MQDDPHGALRSTLSRLMTLGTLVAGVTMLAGLVMMLSSSTAPTDLKHFAARERTSESVGRILSGVTALEPGAVAMLGVLLLLAIPAARTLAAGVIFAKERDGLFVALALLVVGALVVGMLY